MLFIDNSMKNKIGRSKSYLFPLLTIFLALLVFLILDYSFTGNVISENDDITIASGPDSLTYFSAKGVSSDQINLVWYLPDNYNGTIINYSIYRNGIFLVNQSPDPYLPQYPSTGQTLYQDRGLSASTSYTYYIISHDSSGFPSSPSFNVTAQTLSGNAELIPSHRLTNWTKGYTVGVIGGIDSVNSVRTTIVDVTAAPYNVDNTGNQDAGTQINLAISEANPNTIIYLPAGIYRLDNGIRIYTSNITLRGAGTDKTFLVGTPTISLAGDSWTWWNGDPKIPVLSGAEKGSTQIRVSNVTGYYVGNMVQLTTINDLSLPVITPGGGDYLRKQNVIITNISQNNITFFPPIIAEFNSTETLLSTPVGGWPYRLVSFSGIEDLSLNATDTGVQNGITFSAAYSSWLKNVNVISVMNRGLFMYDSLNPEIRHSSFTIDGTGPNHAAMLVGSVTGALIEDNLMGDALSPTGLEVDGSTVGSVISYNYIAWANTNHGAHNSYNLYEGNIVDEFKSDGYYGGESESTFFRNNIEGFIALKRFSRNFNAVGNVIGYAYSFGQPNIGNGGSEGIALPSQGIYWKDWNITVGPRARGTYFKTSNENGTFTFYSHDDALRFYGYMQSYCYGNPDPTLLGCDVPKAFDWGEGKNASKAKGTVAHALNLSEDKMYLIDVYPNSNPYIPNTTVGGIWPRSEGFQELDLDVGLTTIRKENYVAYFYNTTPLDERTNSSIPYSLYLGNIKPEWFGYLHWPPFDPSISNYSLSAIPAGFRALYGVDPPEGSQNASCSQSKNECSSGYLEDLPDSSSDYIWNCIGFFGGLNDSCSLAITSSPSTGGGGGGGRSSNDNKNNNAQNNSNTNLSNTINYENPSSVDETNTPKEAGEDYKMAIIVLTLAISLTIIILAIKLFLVLKNKNQFPSTTN